MKKYISNATKSVELKERPEKSKKKKLAKCGKHSAHILRAIFIVLTRMREALDTKGLAFAALGACPCEPH